MKELAGSEKLVLDYLVKFKSINGFSPTVNEICLGLNTKSKSWVIENLERLEEKNFIVRFDNSPRAINIIRF